MRTAWRGIGLVGGLTLLVACSSQQSLQTTLVLQPEVREQVYQAGRVAFQAQRYDTAAAHFARVVAAAPEHLKARLNWAAALSRSGKPSEAMVQCQNVLARDPAHAEAYYQWGAALRRLEKHQEAMEKFEQAMALKPIAELLQDDPALQQSLEAYLKRQRRQAPEDTSIKVSRPKPTPER